MTNAEFIFNAHVRGYNIAGEDNIYYGKELARYFFKYFNDGVRHEVPDVMDINGTLVLCDYFNSMPKQSITINNGSFRTMINREITALPNEIYVDHELDFSNSSIKSLPNVCHVGSDITLNNSDIEILPLNLIVRGTLNLDDCPNLKVLPDNLIVQFTLHLDNCPNLKVLPKNLCVSKYISIKGTTNITEIPTCATYDKILRDF